MGINLNDPDFVRGLITYDWTYCFNAECPRTAECIRFISSKYKPEGDTMGKAVFPDANLHGPCKHFMRVRLYRAAWGVNRIFDQVKHRDVPNIKGAIMDALGSRTSSYRVYRGEKHLSPEEQDVVAKIFKQHGYEAPTYDHYASEIGFAFE